jgi:hypothetical protein
MKTLVRRIAVVVGAAALSAGLIGAGAPAHAADKAHGHVKVHVSAKDSSWPF